MIRPEHVFLFSAPVDMRWGMDRLSHLIQQTEGRSPCDGTAYGFTNRNCSRIKLLVWDGTGVWLCHRRLHKGRFRWPTPDETLFKMSAEQWRWLTTGVEWQRLVAVPHVAWLKDTLEKLPVWTMRRIDELLPIQSPAQIIAI